MHHIESGKVVQFHYILRNGEGEILDDSRQHGEPMVYLHGAGNMIRGVEQQLQGHPEGAVLAFDVPPELGYGHRRGPAMPFPRHVLPEDMDLTVGTTFTTQGRDGRPMVLWVTKVEGDQVWLDPHHPLAGTTLHYAVEVTSIRDATLDELSKGHPLAGN